MAPAVLSWLILMKFRGTRQDGRGPMTFAVAFPQLYLRASEDNSDAEVTCSPTDWPLR